MADKQDSSVPQVKERKKYRRLGIIRLPNETEEEYQRRYVREKMRLYRAEKRATKPPYIPGTRRGQRRGKLTLPDEMRAELAQREGESGADWKRRYQRAVVKRWRENNKEKAAERRRELYRLNGPGDAKKRWNAANKDKTDAYSRAHFERNRKQKLADLKAWNDAHPVRMKEVAKRWRDANGHKLTAWHAKRRADAAMATPLWVNWKEIEKFYSLAKRLTKKTGIEHQVDHIVPLNGKNVRGLHVPWNLQVLTKAENIAKSNKLDHSPQSLAA